MRRYLPPTPLLSGIFLAVLFFPLAGCGDVSSVSTPPAGPTALGVTTTSLPPATVGQAYSAAVAASGGTAPYTWLVSPNLPSGLSLNPNTGQINGTPSATAVGTNQYTFVVQDAASHSDTKVLSLTVNPPGLVVTPITLPPGVVNQPYPVTTLTATGGVPPYSWSVSPAMPSGLQFNVAGPGTISGTPLNGAVGTTMLTFTVMDTSTPVRQTASIGPLPLTITSLFITTTSPLPNARVGHAYSTTLQRSGGTSPFTWSISSPLPQGLQFSTAGVISGSPTTGTQGTYTRTYTVRDSSNPSQQYSKSLDLTITN
ncbi:MAG TPA: Ig domain-containing protein [Nitrospira sp.]|nr:Ig domain-containing protein [Nitrospira sp.]